MKGYYSRDCCALRVFCLLIITCLGLTATCGCRAKKEGIAQKNENRASSNNTVQRTDKVVALVRSVVMKQGKSLSDGEKAAILQSPPKTDKYRMGLTLWQHRWVWKLPTGCTVTAYYTGDLELVIDPEKIAVFFSDRNN